MCVIENSVLLREFVEPIVHNLVEEYIPVCYAYIANNLADSFDGQSSIISLNDCTPV